MKRSKLTLKDVLRIREECDNCSNKKSRTNKYKSLASQYNVSIATIRSIFHRTRWSDV